MKNSDRRNIVELYEKIKTFQYMHNDTPTSRYTFEETINKMERYIGDFGKLVFSSVRRNTSSSVILDIMVGYKNTYVLVEIGVFNDNSITVRDTFTLVEKQNNIMFRKVEEVNLSDVNLCKLL